MAVVSLDEDLYPYLKRLIAVLDDYDPLTQQKLLELMCVRHALMTGNPVDAKAVALGLCKHIKQMVRGSSV